MMPTSQELIAELRAMGVNNAAIGQALGRDRSLVSQVSRGAKPGNNLTASLAELRDRLATVRPADPKAAAREATVTPPARRTKAGGGTARVRRPTTQRAGHSTSSTVKRQGAQHGARGAGRALGEAIEAGASVAVTIQFSRAVTVSLPGYDKNKRGAKSKEGPGGRLVVALNPDQLATVEDELAGGATPGAAIAAAVIGEGYVYATGGGQLTPAAAVAAMQSIELRTY